MDTVRFIKLLNFLPFMLSLYMNLPLVSSAEVRCKERERQALLQFKHGLIDHYGVLSTWGTERDKRECCLWKGVECSNRTGHVILLDLHASLSDDGSYLKILKGKITPALLELHHLNYLDLSSNDFGGSEMPEFLGSLEKLKHLKLSDTNLSGEIPHQFWNLTEIRTLDLSLNYGLRVKNLEWVSHLSSLSYLDLSSLDLINGTNWLQQVKKLPFLKEIHLKDCNLPNTLPPFDNFANSSLSSLTVLDLSGNNLDSSFPFDGLFNMTTNLNFIDLSNNQFDGPIPEAFGKLTFLGQLYLYDNKFHGGIPKSVGNLSHLALISISGTELNESLPQVFENLSGIALQNIDLSYNHLFGPLPDITKFSSLVWLTLRNNYLTGILPQSLGPPSSLENLYLSYNNISGSLPNLTAFSSLTTLDVSVNLLNRLSTSIGQLSRLELLFAASNLLEGTITEAYFSNLPNLQILDLSSNSLAFNLSSNWVPPFQLQQLILSHCNLGPRFPNWLQNQNSLLRLDFSSVSISGALPDWLWNMSSIQYLDLSHNNISGSIPDFSSKSVYEIIDLSHNNLLGPIPLSLFRSRQLQLSTNMFSGSILHLCKISKDFIVHILDLSDNQLEGELPDCWVNKNNLVVLDLANNKFSGKIPRSLGALDHLKVLHLRNNSFTGELPSSLRNCTGLRMLDVGGNQLAGNIPAWIGLQLTSLTVLSLRFNKFQGIMPPKICHLTVIHVLDLSGNNISGRIPTCLNNITALLQKNSSTETSFEYRGDRFWYEYAGIYVNNALVQWKGREFEYSKLGLLKGIDLSGNNLIGTIPREFSNLKGLVFLNLSRNHLTGHIIPDIGQMEFLEWLDLSRNQFSGKIPESLANLNFLSVLDLSYNNLSGRIPLSTQLQSFNSSSYAGNSQLCGLPLKKCPGDSPSPSVTDHGEENTGEGDDWFRSRDFYICMLFGFITGFWAVIGSLFLKHSWRSSYFNFCGSIGDWIFQKMSLMLRRACLYCT